MADRTPLTLLDRLKQPEADEAWERFVRLYTPLIYDWACRAGAAPEDASDLVQDVMATLVQTLPEFAYDPRQSFRAWLKTITLNRWRRWRSHLARTGTAGEAVREFPAEPQAPEFEEEEYRAFLVARAVAVMEAEFQPATWRACWATVVEDRAATEIAAELGMSVNAVYLAKSRVLRKLHQELRGLLD